MNSSKLILRGNTHNSHTIDIPITQINFLAPLTDLVQTCGFKHFPAPPVYKGKHYFHFNIVCNILMLTMCL